MKDKLIFEDLTYKIRGAAFEVYKEKGCGFLEDVYQECMKLELSFRDIPHIEKPQLQLYYKERPLKKKYEPDFTCYEKIILELKAVSKLVDDHRAQVHNYLKATGFKVGLLINFGHFPKVEIERIVR